MPYGFLSSKEKNDGKMKNLICIFFGHKPDLENKLLGMPPNEHGISITNTGIEIGRFFFCSRCAEIFIDTLSIDVLKK